MAIVFFMYIDPNPKSFAALFPFADKGTLFQFAQKFY
jgi:hypothetical protein